MNRDFKNVFQSTVLFINDPVWISSNNYVLSNIDSEELKSLNGLFQNAIFESFAQKEKNPCSCALIFLCWNKIIENIY